MAKYIRDHIFPSRILAEGWQSRILILWTEDDANNPDRERGDAALQRIVGRQPQAIFKFDGGDHVIHLHLGGWVRIDSFDGTSVGVVVKETP